MFVTDYDDYDFLAEMDHAVLGTPPRSAEHYRHSGGRQIKTLRKLHPEPIIYIHPEAAAELMKLASRDAAERYALMEQLANLKCGQD